MRGRSRTNERDVACSSTCPPWDTWTKKKRRRLPARVREEGSCNTSSGDGAASPRWSPPLLLVRIGLSPVRATPDRRRNVAPVSPTRQLRGHGRKAYFCAPTQGFGEI